MIKADWLEGLAAAGCTFIALKAGGKTPHRELKRYVKCVGAVGVKRAMDWMKRGFNLGILPGPGHWVLDCDTPAFLGKAQEVLADARIIAPWVQTPGGGGHIFFLFPASFLMERIKCHLIHPKDADGETLDCDFKLHGTTIIVLPGSQVIKAEGWREYEAMTPWFTPPEVDPRMFLPEGAFWHPEEARDIDTRPWMACQRPKADRMVRARVYLETKAQSCRSGHFARAKLASIAAHIVKFLGLHPQEAAAMMLRSTWNARCLNGSTGESWPWLEEELVAACEAATSAVPEAGVRLYKKVEAAKARKGRLSGMVADLVGHLTKPESVRVPVSTVRELFGWVTGVENLNETELGLALRAQGVKRIKAGKRKHWHVAALSQWEMLDSLLRAKLEASGTGCPLLREAGKSLGAFFKEAVTHPTRIAQKGGASFDSECHSEVAA